MKPNRAFLLRWHWRIGLAAALFLIVIAVTGLLLNHARLLDLNRVYFDSPFILSLYNMNLPDGYIEGFADTADGTVVQTADGFLVIDSGGHISKAPRPDVQITKTKTVPLHIVQAVSRSYRGEGVTLEKLLLDIHTGRVLGPAGAYITDLAALAILLLSASGIYNWWRRKS